MDGTTEGHRLRSGEDVDGDAEVVGDVPEADTDIALPPEPQLATVREPRGERFRDEEPGPSVLGADRGGIVQQRPRVEDREDLGVWMADHLAVAVGKSREDRGELTARRVMNAL